MTAIQHAVKPKTKITFNYIAISIVALGGVVLTDEMISQIRLQTAMNDAMQPILKSIAKNSCSKNDLSPDMPYSAKAPIGIFPSLFGKLLGFKMVGNLVTESISIEESFDLNAAHRNTKLTIAARDPEAINGWRVTYANPTTACLAILKAG